MIFLFLKWQHNFMCNTSHLKINNNKLQKLFTVHGTVRAVPFSFSINSLELKILYDILKLSSLKNMK